MVSAEGARFIVDPTDPEQAIHVPTGKPAARLYFIPTEALKDAPSLADVMNAGTFIGFAEPSDLGEEE